jgi:hypothetical protein
MRGRTAWITGAARGQRIRRGALPVNAGFITK